MANCPRCQTVMVNNQVDEFSVRLCVPCKGMLMPHPDVVKILERSWHAVRPEDAEKLEFRAPEIPDVKPPYHCPECQALMEKYGYMGLAAIMINRCDHCSLLWLDADELQNMVLALAKTNYRTEQARVREWHAAELDVVSPAMAGAAQIGQRSWLFGNRRLSGGIAAAEVLVELLLR